MTAVPALQDYSGLKTAILAAVGTGIILTVLFLLVFQTSQTSYSAVYIVPSSIRYSSPASEVYFVYGVKCMESGGAAYSLDFYSGDTLIKTSSLTLKNGETFEEGFSLALPAGTTFPDKVRILLHTGTKTEEAHFWVK